MSDRIEVTEYYQQLNDGFETLDALSKSVDTACSLESADLTTYVAANSYLHSISMESGLGGVVKRTWEIIQEVVKAVVTSINRFITALTNNTKRLMRRLDQLRFKVLRLNPEDRPTALIKLENIPYLVTNFEPSRFFGETEIRSDDLIGDIKVGHKNNMVLSGLLLDSYLPAIVEYRNRYSELLEEKQYLGTLDTEDLIAKFENAVSPVNGFRSDVSAKILPLKINGGHSIKINPNNPNGGLVFNSGVPFGTKGATIRALSKDEMNVLIEMGTELVGILDKRKHTIDRFSVMHKNALRQTERVYESRDLQKDGLFWRIIANQTNLTLYTANFSRVFIRYYQNIWRTAWALEDAVVESLDAWDISNRR